MPAWRDKDFDATDLYYGICAFAGPVSLKEMGLTRRQQRQSERALEWFLAELTKSIGLRRKRAKK